MSLLQACLNGRRPGHTPGLPLTPQAMAQDAKACRQAGADNLHVHPRDAQGHETLAPADVAATLRAIRLAVPGMPVGISTGDWIAPEQGRLQDMRAWTELPDYVSINLSEPDAPQVIALIAEMGVGIEFGLCSADCIRRLLSLPRVPATRVMIEIDDADISIPASTDLARRMYDRLSVAMPDLPILLHGFDGNAWHFVGLARDWSCQTRMGLEDCGALPDGSGADNAALIAKAHEIFRGAL